ncbi:MAG: antibiotic biosynthesis monooxygenase [Deltaproteobacteria bacterium]|nr:antibiotic biosynthesis monooxygenase [Deltaproteobacteria bacterium]
MAVKVLIKRKVPLNKAKEIIPLFRKLRILATEQPGYISGETMRRLDKPDEYLVISTWESSEAWKTWVESAERNAVQESTRSTTTVLWNRCAGHVSGRAAHNPCCAGGAFTVGTWQLTPRHGIA